MSSIQTIKLKSFLMPLKGFYEEKMKTNVAHCVKSGKTDTCFNALLGC
jgi:hypothetical protein